MDIETALVVEDVPETFSFGGAEHAGLRPLS
jgi:hypothetical protein